MDILDLHNIWTPFTVGIEAVTPSHYHELIGPATTYYVLTGPQAQDYEVAGPPTRYYVQEGCPT